MKKKFIWWLLRKIVRKLIIQGPLQLHNTVTYFQIFREEFEKYYSEDNKPTIDEYLKNGLNIACGNGIENN